MHPECLKELKTDSQTPKNETMQFNYISNFNNLIFLLLIIENKTNFNKLIPDTCICMYVYIQLVRDSSIYSQQMWARATGPQCFRYVRISNFAGCLYSVLCSEHKFHKLRRQILVFQKKKKKR